MNFLQTKLFKVSFILTFTFGCKFFSQNSSEVKNTNTPIQEKKQICTVPTKITPETIKPLIEDKITQIVPATNTEQLKIRSIHFKFAEGYEKYVSGHLGRIYSLLQHGLAPWGFQLNTDSAVGMCVLLATQLSFGGQIQRPILIERSIQRDGEKVTVTSIRQMPDGQHTSIMSYQKNGQELTINNFEDKNNKNKGPSFPKPASKLTSKFVIPQEKLNLLIKFISEKTRLPQISILDAINLGNLHLIAAINSLKKNEVYFFLTDFLTKGNLGNIQNLLVSTPENQLSSKTLKISGLEDFEFLKDTTVPNPIKANTQFSIVISISQSFNIVATKIGVTSQPITVVNDKVIPIVLYP